ncbi:MAG: hypothetical protein IKA71_00575 [Lentisphaeria bacterium]|nr:hypothetical protein [Lentisphaeria bacterium]
MKRLLISAITAGVILMLSGGENNCRMIFSGDRTRLFQNEKEVDFAGCLRKQLADHPEMEMCDVLKLIYQSAYGPRHALIDRSAAYRVFMKEFDEISGVSGSIFEIVSPDICRVDLRAWKGAGLPGEWLFQMFTATAEKFSGGDDLFHSGVKAAEKVLSGEKFARLKQILQEYNGKPVHHSAKYRKLYAPAYRIVSTRFITVLPVLLAAVELPEKPVRVIAVDGRAASGKSTLARMLARIMDAGVIHMDDFFLPPELRTAERFAQAGGNVHYERFIQEVLPFLRDKKQFSYRIFDCKQMKLTGRRSVAGSSWRIVEGAYSMHPEFGKYADLNVFFDIAPAEQLRRIRLRNGEAAAKVFAERWIPFEENHIRNNQVVKRADLILGR